jgi:hypothetical protein
MKPTLRAPKFKLLKLEHEEVLSNHAFKFNLRRYSQRTGARLAHLGLLTSKDLS